eukprot:2896411-Rhodomonas_salina.3
MMMMRIGGEVTCKTTVARERLSAGRFLGPCAVSEREISGSHSSRCCGCRAPYHASVPLVAEHWPHSTASSVPGSA